MKVPQRGLVLDKGPSDHAPVVRRFWYADRLDAPPILAGFWNVNHATTARRAAPTFDDLRDLGVDVLILNEVKSRSGIADMLHDEFGYGIRWHAPEFAAAWSRERFAHVRSRPLVMSEHDYWLDRNEALAVVLKDKAAETQVKVISEHPPAHVARPEHPTFDKVLAVHQDIAKRNARIARHSRMPVLIGRDSNIDPHKDRPVVGHSWEWAYPPPLHYVRAARATHGHEKDGRFIDEFLTTGLTTAPREKP